MKILLLSCCVITCAIAQAQWAMQRTGTTASLRGLSVVSNAVVWASGSAGTYLRTIDGGKTWRAGKVAGAEELDFRGVRAFDANTAVLMSSGPAEQGRARIYRTQDGGASWKLVYSTTAAGVFLDAIAFWDVTHGIAVGDPVDGHFFVIVTDDAGKSWHSISEDSHPGRMPAALAKEGSFAASNSCLAVQGSSKAWFVTGGAGVARVFYSSDRGRTWQVATTPLKAEAASAGLFSVTFRDARHGMAVGGDYQKPKASGATVVITSDGGRSWRLAASPVAGLFLSGVAWIPVSDARGDAHRPVTTQAIAVGSAGWSESDDGGEHWPTGGNEGFNVVAVPPFTRSGRKGGASSSAGQVWAAGSEGRIARKPVAGR